MTRSSALASAGSGLIATEGGQMAEQRISLLYREREHLESLIELYASAGRQFASYGSKIQSRIYVLGQAIERLEAENGLGMLDDDGST
jgi:uncharacterized protein YfcZ (UPF0381/DUF406 family)